MTKSIKYNEQLLEVVNQRCLSYIHGGGAIGGVLDHKILAALMQTCSQSLNASAASSNIN